MKFSILFLILLISPIELRRRDDDDNNDIYELSDLLGDRYDRHEFRPKPTYGHDETNNDDDDESGREYPAPVFPGSNVHPSRKKVLDDNDSDNQEPDADEASTRRPPSTTTVAADSSDSSVCLNQYETKPEQLVKVKELTNGAHMIRYVLIDKRTLPDGVKVKDTCMQDCCAEKTCDLAMLSEQPTHDGYKCYLFACNGSCILAPHKDYSVMTLGTASVTSKVGLALSSAMPSIDALRKKSFFRETTVIAFLAFGVISTVILLVVLCCHCRQSRRRGLKVKNYSVDEDYLINGLYL